MKKKALLIFIIIALFVTGIFLAKAFGTTPIWQTDPNASPYQSQPNSDVRQPANHDTCGSLYSPMNLNYQPKYDWYNSPHNDGWNNAYRDWWCW